MKEKKLFGAALKSHLAKLARLAGLPPLEPKVVKTPALTAPWKISTFEKHRESFRRFSFSGYQYNLGGHPATRREVSSSIERAYAR